MKIIFFLFIFVALLSACAPDPRNIADANKTNALTEQEVLDRTQERALSGQLQAIKIEEQKATELQRIQARRLTTLASGIAFSIVFIGYAIVAVYLAGSSARAFERQLDRSANLIRLDPNTRSWPIIITYANKGIISVGDPNTGQVMKLDTRQPADRKLLDAFLRGQITQTVAKAASKSNNSADIVTIGRGKYE